MIKTGSFISSTTPCGYLRLIVLAVLLLAAGTQNSTASEYESDEPWHIVADTFSYNNETHMYTAEGNVVVTQGDKRLSSDFVEYDTLGRNAFARGHVTVSSQNDTMTADRAIMDFDAGTGTLYNGSVFIETNHLYIKGDRIKKTGENTYTADKVRITTCDGDTPDWSFTGRDLKVTIEGYGTVYHAAFWTKKLPVLYSPFFFFPVKIKRQTGLLPPQFTLKSDRKGFEYLQPFFWAINDSSDATLYSRYMSKRGTMIGGEYRYMLSSKSKGTLMYDTLEDKKIDDTTPQDFMENENLKNNWGYDDSGNRLNTHRYWLRTKHNQELPSGVSMKLDVDVVSDQDYLREFDNFKNGYDDTKDYFTNYFGRDIEAEDDHIRTNSIIFNKTWTSYSLNASSYWYDNVVSRKNDTEDTTLQKLPTIEFNASRQQFLKTPFYFDLDSDYTYFFRQDTTHSKYNGQRIDLLPKAYLPLRIKNWFTFEPAIGFRETFWYIANDTDVDDEEAGSHNRNIYDLSVDLSSDIYRVFNTNLPFIDKIKHTLTPKLVYEYTPERDQQEYPYFDGVDRIEKNNIITFSLTNYLTSRSLKQSNATDPIDKSAEEDYSYRQFCRFKLEQAYDLNEDKETDPSEWRNQVRKEREPFLPLYGEIEFNPMDHITFTADGKWSKYTERMTEGNFELKLSDWRGDSFKLGQRYKSRSYHAVGSKYLTSSLTLKINNRISVYGENERDLREREDVKTAAGLMFNAQCWGVHLNYTNEPDDKRYTLTVSLRGLGDFGSSYGLEEKNAE